METEKKEAAETGIPEELWQAIGAAGERRGLPSDDNSIRRSSLTFRRNGRKKMRRVSAGRPAPGAFGKNFIRRTLL